MRLYNYKLFFNDIFQICTNLMQIDEDIKIMLLVYPIMSSLPVTQDN